MEVPENASYCCYGNVILALLLGSLGNLFDVAPGIAEVRSTLVMIAMLVAIASSYQWVLHTYQSSPDYGTDYCPA